MHTMALQLGAVLYYCCGEGWQCDWLGGFDGPLLTGLCLYQSL